MSRARFDIIDAGTIIQYVLLPSSQPTNPNKLWRGKVERVTRSKFDRGIVTCRIQSIEPGYEGIEEYVYPEQIVNVEGQEKHGDVNNAEHIPLGAN